MGISKCRVDLDSSSVALHGTLDILHLFERVTHVRISISKVWMDPGVCV